MLSPTPLLTASLIPTARFGALLFRERSRTSMSLSELSRATGGRFLPDRLLRVERGEVCLDDADVEILCGAYGVEFGPWRPTGKPRLVLDRSSVSDFLDRSARAELDELDPEAFADRFCAVALLVGFDLTGDGFGLEPLAEALDLGALDTWRLVRRRLQETAGELGEIVGRLRRQPTVPAVGVLVGESRNGALVIASSPV